MSEHVDLTDWTVFGNTLYLGVAGRAYVAFPGDAASAHVVAAAHNALLRRLEEAQARATILAAQLAGWEAQCAAQVEAAQIFIDHIEANHPVCLIADPKLAGQFERLKETITTEAAQTANEARTDPDQARRLIRVLYSLSVEDRAFALLLRLFLEGMLMRLIQERAEQDDAYALECGTLIVGLMEQMAPPQRGRPRPTKSA